MFFERGSARFCAPVDEVQAIAQVGEVHALPFLRKGIAGVFMFRGRMALLCDPGAALGLETGNGPAAATLAIVVAFPEGTVAFRVDRVTEIVPAASLQRPAGEHNALTGWMDGYAMQGPEIAFLTTFDKLMRLLIEADLEGGLAAVLGAAASAATAPAAPPEPARIARPEESAKAADARAPAKPQDRAIRPPSPLAPPPVRSAARPARAPAMRQRPVRTASIRPPVPVAHRRIELPQAEPPEAETHDALPVEPDYAPEPESAAPEQRAWQTPVPAPDAARARVSPPQTTSQVVAVPVAAAGPAAAARVDPRPATVAQGDDRAPPARRPFAPAVAAGALLA
ncbi:MAG TPA: chemotaxis protein CheW, partial [Burkholderiales bacterium]|nr:chemotaxis protein CheW [Burkholderiales bacterium]